MSFQKAIAIFLISIGTISASSASAQSSKDLSMMGVSSWSALECSALASVLEDTKEQERLFRIGYESGKKFIAAVQSKRITEEDLNNEVPSGFLLVMAGPTSDFILGRVFESAVDNVTKNIFSSGTGLNSKELQKSLAQNKFAQKNCRLLR